MSEHSRKGYAMRDSDVSMHHMERNETAEQEIGKADPAGSGRFYRKAEKFTVRQTAIEKRVLASVLYLLQS